MQFGTSPGAFFKSQRGGAAYRKPPTSPANRRDFWTGRARLHGGGGQFVASWEEV